MTDTRRKVINPPRLRAGEQVDFAPPAEPRSKRKPKPKSLRDFERVCAAAKSLKDAGRIDDFKPQHFVAMYALLHRHVYGVMPDEIRRDWKQACLAAARILKNDFGGSKARMAQFLRWTWDREAKRVERSSGEVRRVVWRLQFGPLLLSDYRVARVTRGRRRGRR